MKQIFLLIFVPFYLFGFSEFSVSGKPTSECQKSLYSVELHNNQKRFHCSLYSVYNDSKLYEIKIY